MKFEAEVAHTRKMAEGAQAVSETAMAAVPVPAEYLSNPLSGSALGEVLSTI